MKESLGAVAFVIVLFAALALGPWLTIWAINEFGQYLWPGKPVPFNIWTWGATLVLYSFFNSTSSYNKK